MVGNAATPITLVVSDDQGERSVERWREFEPQRRGAGPDERRGSENEQRSSHHVAGVTEWMVSFKPLFLPSMLAHMARIQEI